MARWCRLIDLFRLASSILVRKVGVASAPISIFSGWQISSKVSMSPLYLPPTMSISTGVSGYVLSTAYPIFISFKVISF